ncbi:hypothetical protein [Amycolatopsis dendrobii]|uniref:Uncharacterized protein n=1 Tax=Amycolatopsis dendrobii TaxID=2760662 RepID=A0A7W3VUH9_9PSEU|nr:hypothetical protein [Amycolatopsis dendrobii]MBB1153453.1 hypothetical protein [Amycolatopsis dendrobii]
MDSTSTKPAPDAEPSPPEPGAGNGLDHVRGLFFARFPGPWPHGFLAGVAKEKGVTPDLIHRVFRANPAWRSIPKGEVIAGIATALGLPRAAVHFAFMADLHPDACDENMYRVLSLIASMTPAQIREMEHAALRIAHFGSRR